MGANTEFPEIHLELVFGGESSNAPAVVVATSTSAMHSVVELVCALCHPGGHESARSHCS